MPRACFAICLLAFAASAHAQVSKDALDEAKRALELRIYEATADAVVAQRLVEAKAASAEAERAAILARLPPATTKALDGMLDVRDFGAAGRARAFDLAVQLAGELCARLPDAVRIVIYEPATARGVLAARLVDTGLRHNTAGLERHNRQLQQLIDRHAPPQAAWSPVVLAAFPALARTVADGLALFRDDITARSAPYGDGARALFASALAQACPGKLQGLGAGYLGELDQQAQARLQERIDHLQQARGELALRIETVTRLAAAASGDDKKLLAGAATAAGSYARAVDQFTDSLRIGEADDTSPYSQALRYLAYGERTRDALLLDFDLQLEGMTVVKNNLFGGQKLRLAGMALLWYRLQRPDGGLVQAATLRHVTRPEEVDLRGPAAPASFFDPGASGQ